MNPLGAIVGQFLNTSAVLSVVVVAINYLRPLVERFVTPGSQAENNVLQLLNYALNFIGLYLLNVYQLGGQLPDAPQVVGIFSAAIGGAVGSHIVYAKTKSTILARQTTPARTSQLAGGGIAQAGVAHFYPPVGPSTTFTSAPAIPASPAVPPAPPAPAPATAAATPTAGG